MYLNKSNNRVNHRSIHCFDTTGWATERASDLSHTSSSHRFFLAELQETRYDLEWSSEKICRLNTDRTQQQQQQHPSCYVKRYTVGRVQFCWLKFVLDTVVSFEHINILMILLQTQHLQWGPRTAEHWLLDCSALSLTRIEIFGRHDLNLDVLATSTKQVIALSVLWRVCHHRQQQQQQ